MWDVCLVILCSSPRLWTVLQWGRQQTLRPSNSGQMQELHGIVGCYIVSGDLGGRKVFQGFWAVIIYKFCQLHANLCNQRPSRAPKYITPQSSSRLFAIFPLSKYLVIPPKLQCMPASDPQGMLKVGKKPCKCSHLSRREAKGNRTPAPCYEQVVQWYACKCAMKVHPNRWSPWWYKFEVEIEI